ncbi:hypothetical protein [Demequina sp.]|uniref:hypothetical protein n=1 Tax=Demequina sp. TaxID=2050685 RepID=UPI003D0D799B
MTQPQPPEQPRTWLPLIIAGSIAVLVVLGATITHLLRADLSPEKQAAADACEAQYHAQNADGPGITGGDIYSATEWEALDARMVSLDLADEQTLTGEQADARDSEAAALVSAGGDQMTVIWQLDDQSHAQCVADLQGGKVTTVTVTSLAAPATSPSPSPSPSES